MSDPLGWLRTSEVAILLAIAATGAYLLWPLFPRLKPPSSTEIFGFQLAWRTARVREILAEWQRLGLLGRARTMIDLDWPFIPLYSSTLALAGTLAGRAVGTGDGETAAALLAYGAVAAALLDVSENVGLLAMLGGRTGQPVPALTSTAALGKWVLVFLVPLGVLVLLFWAALG